MPLPFDPARRMVPEQTVMAARDRLAAEPAVDASRLAAVGYSLGGHFALSLAAAGKVSAAVVYFGTLSPWSSEMIGRLAVPVLIHQGDQDSSAITANASALPAEALRQGKRLEFVVYTGAVHQFDLFEPKSSATREAWQRSLAFLASTLGSSP